MSVVLDRISRYARNTPQQIALNDGQRTLNYAQLLQAVDTLAEAMKSFGLQRLGIAGDNSLEWIIADLAAWKAQIVTVPVPGFFSQEQITHLKSSAQLDAVITQQPSTADNENDAYAPTDSILAYQDLSFCLKLTPPSLAQAKASPRIPAGTQKITFTSGSTGQPKGVCLSSASLEATSLSLSHALATQHITRHLSVMPYATLLENIAGVYVPLLEGATIHVRKMADIGLASFSQFNPLQFARSLLSTQPNSIILVPQLLLALVSLREANVPLPDSLQFIAVGGGKVSTALLARAQTLGLPVFEGYGLSECNSVISLNRPEHTKIGSVGKVLSHAEVRIAQDGEIQVKGSLMQGYLDSQASVDDWYGTGDLGRIDEEGFLFVDGRKKNLFVTAFGRNVNPEWVEAELTQQPSIQQALVFGNELTQNLAIIVPRGDANDATLLQDVASANRQLPEYAQISHALVYSPGFTCANGLATANGRIKRSAIETQFADVLTLTATQMSEHSAPTISRLSTAPNPHSATQQHPEETIMTNQSLDAIPFFDQLQAETQAGRDYLLSAPVIDAVKEGRFNLESYRYFLSQAFYHVKHTVPLMMACGARLNDDQEWVRKAIVEYINEEYGHHEWILNDIEACGGDVDAVRKGQADQAMRLMVAYLYDYIQRINPLGFFGMVQVLEGTSIKLASQMGRIVQQTLNLPDQAFSYLYSHGELDLEHFEFFRMLMNGVKDSTDQQAIIDVANQCYQLYGDMLRAIPLGETVQNGDRHAA